MSEIRNDEITFVVQGAIDKINTPVCLNLIRRHFKGSAIILSTWENSDVEGLDYDNLVLNEDPGGFSFSEKFYDNTNRQIISSRNGIAASNTEYTCKIRSDVALLSNRFVNYFDKFKRTSGKYEVYEKRIITYVFPSKFQHEDEITPFHICDWLFFGRTKDLRKMFDIELIEEENCAFNGGVFPSNAPERFYKNPQKYFPEQYICYKALEKEYPAIGFHHRFCNDKKIVDVSNEFIANNYCILCDFQMPLYFMKKNRNEYCNLSYEYWNNSISYFKWLDLYKQYCDSDFSYPTYKRTIYEKAIQLIYKNNAIRSFIQKLFQQCIERQRNQ